MMIVHPDFLDHWKTQLLVQLTGDKTSPLLILRLWAHCQQRRQGTFQNVTPQILKAICRWEGDAEVLQKALLDSGFIEIDGSTVTVHEWSIVNAKLFQSWENGTKGGRPRKTQRKPNDNPNETDKRGEDGETTRQETEYPAHGEKIWPEQASPSLKEIIGHANVIGLPPDEVQTFFDYYEQRGWNDRNGQPIRNWQAALRRWKVTGQAQAKNGYGRKSMEANYNDPNDPLTGQKGKPS